jgi:hypothetical protein
MAKDKAPNYTPAQEQRIRDEAPLNAEKATALGLEFGKSPRSVIAKAVRMNVGYTAKQPTTKTGEPIVKKADLVSEIGEIVSGNLDGLDKAPKPALVAIAAHLRAAGNDA